MIHVTIYNEFVHEKTDPAVGQVYPKGIHGALQEALECEDITVKTVTLEDVEQKLTREELDKTDVLIWWGHKAHKEISDELAKLIQNSVLRGMGFIALHSAHKSKPFMALMGTASNVTWRESDDLCRLWVCEPTHPICRGIDRFVEVPHEETYSEPFGIPKPDELLFIGWYSGGEVFRAGCTWQRGLGKVFYFQPGHETCPTYYIPEVQTVIRNAVRWAVPVMRVEKITNPKAPVLTQRGAE